MTERAIVVFGDVVDSRLDGPAAARWLRLLAADLDDAFGAERCAPFGFTQGDELQGALRPTADPLVAVLRATLREERPPLMRWAIAAGTIEPGEGPATQRTGTAFLRARELSVLARRNRDRLVCRSGHAPTDAILADVAPVLGVLLAELTERQRIVARLLVVDGLRQIDAAARLGIARPTISVAAERGRVREIERLRRAVRTMLWTGIAAESDGAAGRVAHVAATSSTPASPSAEEIEAAPNGYP